MDAHRPDGPPPPAAPPAPPVASHRAARARPLSLADVRAEALSVDRYRSLVPTGFAALDTILGGGLRTQNLTVVGGRPGAGKTITVLQWARQMALSGETVVIACYEHDERSLMERLLLLELGELAGEVSVTELSAATTALADASHGEDALEAAMVRAPALRVAHERMAAYDERVLLVRADGASTDVGQLTQIVADVDATVLVVDYLQKVPADTGTHDPDTRVAEVAQGLKDLAMERDIAVVAIAIADRSGLQQQRLRLDDLEGSATLTYEADAVLILNNKYDVVHRNHIVYDPEGAKEFRRWVVFTIEKHRDGPEGGNLQFRKDFRHYRFDPSGTAVHERLVDDRLDAQSESR